MRKLLFLCVSMFMLGSCVTILNSENKKVSVYTDRPAKVIVGGDTVSTVQKRDFHEAEVSFMRRRENAHMDIVADTISKPVEVLWDFDEKLFASYYFGVFSPVNFILDGMSDKKYTYPSKLYIDLADKDLMYKTKNIQKKKNEKYPGSNKGFVYTAERVRQEINFRNEEEKRRMAYVPEQKGQLLFYLGFPHVNTFNLLPDNELRKMNTGFWGISLGLEYFHHDRRFLKFTANGAMDIFVPVPAAVDIQGEHESMSTLYVATTNNHLFNIYRNKKFVSAGYGLSYGTNYWSVFFHGDDAERTRPDARKSTRFMGLAFPVFYRGRSFTAGVVYRPTFIRFDSPRRFCYEYLVSVEVGWRVRLEKLK